jgi:hypothetical protein
VTFNEVPYGYITPQLVKTGFDGPPVAINLNSPSLTLSLPFPQRSPFKIQNFTGNVVHEDSINISFNLDRPMPVGKFCRIAVLYDSTASLSPNNYGTADIISTVSQYNTINISNLTAFRTRLATLPKNSTFYIGIIPVSYGLYESTLFPKPVLLGENLYYPGNLSLNKNW